MTHVIHLSDEAFRLFGRRADRLGLSVTEYLNEGAPRLSKSRNTDSRALVPPGKIHSAETGESCTPRALKLSKEIYRYLRNDWNVLKNGAISYQHLGEALGVHHRTLAHCLSVIQDHCRARRWPTLTVFVVRKQGGLPSTGCDVTLPQEFVSTAREARFLNWRLEPRW